MALLWVSRVLLVCLALCTGHGSSAVIASYSTNKNNGSACDILASRFPGKTFIAGTTQYRAADDGKWCSAHCHTCVKPAHAARPMPIPGFHTHTHFVLYADRTNPLSRSFDMVSDMPSLTGMPFYSRLCRRRRCRAKDCPDYRNKV